MQSHQTFIIQHLVVNFLGTMQIHNVITIIVIVLYHSRRYVCGVLCSIQEREGRLWLFYRIIQEGSRCMCGSLCSIRKVMVLTIMVIILDHSVRCVCEALCRTQNVTVDYGYFIVLFKKIDM